MTYEIKREPFTGQLCSADQAVPRRGKGPMPRYPLRDMRPGDWIMVPREEETVLWRSARNAKQNHGIAMQVTMTADGKHWHVLCVDPTR